MSLITLKATVYTLASILVQCSVYMIPLPAYIKKLAQTTARNNEQTLMSSSNRECTHALEHQWQSSILQEHDAAAMPRHTMSAADTKQQKCSHCVHQQLAETHSNMIYTAACVRACRTGIQMPNHRTLSACLGQAHRLHVPEPCQTAITPKQLPTTL
jgi:hypothetical protein